MSTDAPVPIKCDGPADVAVQFSCMPPAEVAKNLEIVFRGIVKYRGEHGDSFDDACEVACSYVDGIVAELHRLHDQEYQ